MKPSKLLLPLSLLFLFSSMAFAQKEKCLGLKLHSIKVVDECDKFVVVDATIENNGLRTIDLPNKKSLGLQYHWSGTETYQPGCVFVGGTFIENFGDYGAHLSPDGVYTMRIKVSKAHKTNTLKFLILYIDPLYKFDECDEIDNTKSILIMN